MSLTKADLEALLAGSTPGAMRLATMNPDLDPVEMFRDCLSHGEGDVWGIMAADHAETIGGNEDRPDHGVMTAWVGNGPTSEGNANLYLVARDLAQQLLDASAMLDEIERFVFECEAGPLENCVDWRNLREKLGLERLKQ